jgi:hypothetical protein
MGDQENHAIVTVKENNFTSLQCHVLNPNNYNIWAIRIKVVFKVHGILEAIEPQAIAALEAKKDDMAVALLYQAIP